MKKNKQLDKAQDGTQVTAPSPTFSLDQSFMEKKYGGYKPSLFDSDPVRYSSRGRFSTRPPAEVSSNSTENMLNYLSAPGDKGFSPEINTLDEFAEARTGRYENYLPGYNMEEAEALGQSTASKAFNGITKGLGLMGTTFLNSTANLVYGAIKWGQTGEFSSFYDNDFTRSLDKFNRGLEDSMPNYYTQAERNADFNSPDYFFTSNFLWDGVIKNLGFAAGAALSGQAYTAALKAIPITSRLFAAGKGAEALAATEAGLASNTGKVSSTYGRLLELNKQFTSGYNSMNAGGRAVVAGLATTGEASIEAMHNLHELEETLTKDFIDANGYYPSSSEMKNIKDAAKGAGNKTFLANFALLTATNYIQFPKILGSTYKGEKNVANNIIGDLSSLVNRNKNILASEVGDVVKEGGEYVIKKSKYPKLTTLGRAIKNPYLFSYSEAFEEVGQFTAATATKDYYEKKSKGDAASWLESFGVGIKEGMLSDEGAKNALIGGLSGAIMLSPGKFRAAARKKRDTQNFVSALNSSDLGTAFSSFTKETYDSLERSTVLQQERVAAIKEGRILDSKDLEADYIINYLTPRIKYGRLDLVTADINEYRKLASTAEGFAQLQAEGKALQTDTAESYLKRLDNFEQSANSLDTLWQSINLRYSALKDEEGNPLYSSDVVNKMIYTASKIADYDLRIPEITQDLMSAGVDVAGLTKGLLEGNLDEFNKAYEQIQNLNTVSKNELTEKLKDVSELILRRQEFFNTYEDIKANPLNFREAKVADETKAPDSVETITVKTKQGEKDIEIGTEYFSGKGVDYNKETLALPIPISKFSVLGVSENGKLKIQNLDTGVESEISVEEFENLKVGKVSSLKNNSTANYFYEHRNEIFKFNFGKKRGGPRAGRIEYQDGKLYFVYLTAKGKIKKIQVYRRHLETKEGFDRSILYREGTIENQNQKSAREIFLSAKEIAQEEATLAQNRETRLEIISQLGEEAQENLIETNKKIDKAKKDLTKVKEDLESIQKMKESGPTGPKIKLNFSKATRSFTRAINKLQAMQNDLNEIINNSEQERNELEFNIAYFQDFTNEIIILPEDTGEFMEELKDQVSLLVDNSKNLKNAIVAAKKAAKQAENTIKSATKVFRSALKSTYIIDEDYSQYLNELLDQVAAGENLEVTWPLLKQELANFALTTNLSIEANINEPGLIKAITDLQKLQKDLADMNSEYTARKIILDRYQKIRDEFKAQQAAEEKLQVKLKAVMNTADKGTPIVQTEKGYEPESKKPLDVLSKATTFRDTRKGEELTPDEFRANQFGIDLDSFDNRKKIRGLYITKEIENDLLPGLVERVLQDSEGNEERTKELIEKYESSVIVMVMVDENGSLVGVDGKPIPEGQPLLDNAIFQVIPEEGFNNGEMFRNDTPQDTKDFIIKEYKKFRDNILAQKTLGVPFKVSASFGVSQNVQDTSRTSVKDAGLITDSDLEKEILLNVPTTNKTIDKGTTQYTSPLGSVYLELKNGLVKLKNRLHTSKDASAIYDSILQLSKNLLDANEGIESDSSIRILNFLRGVTYWGIPANNAGNNSAFFEKDKDGKLMLRLSDKGITFRFTPSALQLNKDTIIQTLESMYNNVNKSKTKDINEKFEQIVSISPEGKIKSIVWPNYQSYLLSSKGREDFELPLYTIMKPKVEGETNREGVYFVNNTTADNFKIPEPKTQAVNIPIKKSANYVVDGKTVNTYTSPTSGKKILFTVNGFGGVISNENIEILPGADRNSVKATDDQIKTSIVYSMAPEVAKENAQKSYTESIAPKAPVKPAPQTSEVESNEVIGTPVERSKAETELDELQNLINQSKSDINLGENLIKEDIDIDLSKFDSADVKELEEKGYSKEKIKDILIKKCND